MGGQRDERSAAPPLESSGRELCQGSRPVITVMEDIAEQRIVRTALALTFKVHPSKTRCYLARTANVPVMVPSPPSLARCAVAGAVAAAATTADPLAL